MNEPYLLYATRRFGFFEGMRRWWTYNASPVNWWKWAVGKYRLWKCVDRREKYRHGWHTVYLANRDGDFGIIECPRCNQFQTLCYSKGRGIFDCYECDIMFRVYLEDGLLHVRDHREGNIPTPAKVVEDDTGKYHMGLVPGAPWWWRKYDVYRDFNPDNGMDGHGHEPYEILGPILSQPLPEGMTYTKENNDEPIRKG